MSSAALYPFAAVALIVVGLDGLIRREHLMRKILALNVIGSGVFLVIGAVGRSASSGSADPVAQALIITGIVVAIAATALALALMVRVADETGRAEIDPPTPSGDRARLDSADP